jgi:hypothetical protein
MWRSSGAVNVYATIVRGRILPFYSAQPEQARSGMKRAHYSLSSSISYLHLHFNFTALIEEKIL